jgi:hypothetical protein
MRPVMPNVQGIARNVLSFVKIRAVRLGLTVACGIFGVIHDMYAAVMGGFNT